MMRKTKDAAVGKWASILSMMGVPDSALTGKHGPCPICPDGGKDRFRFANTNGRGEYFCNQCGNGDGFDIVQKLFNVDYIGACRMVDEKLGVATTEPVAAPQNDDQKRNKLNNMRKRFRPLSQSQSVMNYLRSRGITDQTLQAIRPCLGSIENFEYYVSSRIAHRFDSMIAKVTKYGKPVTYHVTYTDNGAKPENLTPRKLMPPVGGQSASSGSVIELFEHSGVLGVAEGIETALSCYQAFGVPTWATISANNMKAFTIPKGVTELQIFADNDESKTGHDVSQELFEKATYQGIKANIMMPSTVGHDWNDVLLEG